eukprot:14046984-Ditylum_brightwellii.AAC.1
MTKAVSSSDLPNDAIVHNKLEYYMLYHPINNLQQRLTMQKSGGIKASILVNSVSFAFLENNITLVDRPDDTDNINDTMALLYDLPSETDKDLTKEFEEWVKYDMYKDLQRVVPSILQSDTGVALVHAPRHHPQYCLSKPLFQLALNRFLVVLLMAKTQHCKCGKMVDLVGNHFFSCIYFSKKWLHDHCVDAHYLCLKTTAHLSGLADHKNDVHHEPANILHSCPG